MMQCPPEGLCVSCTWNGVVVDAAPLVRVRLHGGLEAVVRFAGVRITEAAEPEVIAFLTALHADHTAPCHAFFPLPLAEDDALAIFAADPADGDLFVGDRSVSELLVERGLAQWVESEEVPE